MQKQRSYPKILTGNTRLGPYPMEKLKRVDEPTIKISDNVERFDERENGFNRARRGDFGPAATRRGFAGTYPLSVALERMTRSLAPLANGDTASSKAPLPEDPMVLSRHIKRLGYFLKADIVGICQLPQYAVYSQDKNGNPVELDHQFAIVILVDQDYETMSSSTGHDWISRTQSFRGYSMTTFITCVMADYIRSLGYQARAQHSGNYQVVLPPLLLQSGIGEMSRAGIILNPFLGLRFKAAVVTTNLPLAPDKPVDFGLQKFCQRCLKCAVECPSRAISSGDKIMYNGYETWKLDVERCVKFRIMNPNGSGCGRCLKVCPWNKPEGWTHDTVRWMVKHTPFMDRFIVKMDDIWGYGKQDIEDKWWLDLETRDGTVQLPRKSQDPTLE